MSGRCAEGGRSAPLARRHNVNAAPHDCTDPSVWLTADARSGVARGGRSQPAGRHGWVEKASVGCRGGGRPARWKGNKNPPVRENRIVRPNGASQLIDRHGQLFPHATAPLAPHDPVPRSLRPSPPPPAFLSPSSAVRLRFPPTHARSASLHFRASGCPSRPRVVVLASLSSRWSLSW